MDWLEFLADQLDWLGRIVTFLAVAGAAFGWLRKRYKRAVVCDFFGGSSITTYFPLRELDGRSAIAEADFTAAHHLSTFLSKHGVSVQYRFVDVDGDIDLSETGIVAICGPKSSRLVAEALKRDSAIQFSRDENGHYALVDRETGERHRSAQDIDHASADIGYLARNETAPGSQSTFISVAGIHAEGSAAVIKHLCDDLHKRTRDSLFSCIISGKFRSTPFKVTSTEEKLLRLREPAKPDSLASVDEAPTPESDRQST